MRVREDPEVTTIVDLHRRIVVSIIRVLPAVVQKLMLPVLTWCELAR